MDTLDELAARSVAVVRADADAVADTENPLRDVKDGVTVTTVRPVDVRPQRRWWLGVAAAAAVVGIVTVGAVVVTRHDPDTVVPAAAPETTVTVVATPPVPDAGAPLSEPPTLVEADAQVLYETMVGDEHGQLGVEDELRPLAPIVQADGTVVIGDPVNSRWIEVHGSDVVEMVIVTSEAVALWDAVQGVEGTLYSLFYARSNEGLVNGRVQYNGTESTGSFPTNVGDCCRRLLYDGSVDNGGEPHVTDDAVVVMADAGAPVVIPSPPGTMSAVYPDGADRTWAVPPNESAMPAELHQLPNGELVLLQRSADPANLTWTVHLLRLDGAVATEIITLAAVPGDNIGKFSVGVDGVSMLQRVDDSTFRVLRFPLPTTLIVYAPVPTTVVDETVVATTVVVEPTVSTVVDTAPATTEAPVDSLGGTVLYEATVGSDPGQLGLEDCQECEPLASLAPMVAPDGSIIIADTFNRRWVTVRDGVESYIPYPADTIVQDAVLGRDGNVYWVEFDTNPIAPAPLFHGVQSAPFDDLAAAKPMQLPAFEGAGFGSISFDGSGEPAVEDPTLTLDQNNQWVVRHGLLEPTLSATMDDDGGSTVVATYVDGTTQSWTLGISGLDPQLPTLHVVDDDVVGEDRIVAIQTSPLSQDARIVHFVNVLYPDGTISTVNLPPGVTTAGSGGHWSITPDGVTTLVFDDETQTFQVVRFPLPS